LGYAGLAQTVSRWHLIGCCDGADSRKQAWNGTLTATKLGVVVPISHAAHENILKGRWADLPRIAAALAVRRIRRALPLLGNAPENAEIRRSIENVIKLATDFASGSVRSFGVTSVAARTAAHALPEDQAKTPVGQITVSAHWLAESVRTASAFIADLELHPDLLAATQDAFAASTAVAWQAAETAGEVLYAAACDGRESRGEDARGRVKQALDHDDVAVDHYRLSEAKRLGGEVPYGEFPLGPPLNPNENGPLGPLWPAGAPSWFGQKATPKLSVVSLREYPGIPERRYPTTAVAYLPSARDAEGLQQEVADLLNRYYSASPGGAEKRLLPKLCVYLPETPEAEQRAAIASKLSAHGAIVFGQSDLPSGQPSSEDEFVAVLSGVLSRSDNNAARLRRSLGVATWAQASRDEPRAEGAPTNLATIKDAGRKRVKHSDRDYDRVIGSPKSGGWPTAG
jgi:hypothetical protein